MDATYALGAIGLAAAAICIVAYIWGYVFKAQGFRPLNVLSLFATVVAMAQIALMLTGQGGAINAAYAMIFLLISGISQALSAVKGRAPRDRVRTRESDGLG